MKRTPLSVLLLVIAIVCACQKAPELTLVSPESIDFGFDASSSSISFTANRYWTISPSDSWITVSPSSGEASKDPVTIKVSCSTNTTYDDREATLTIKMEELSKVITLKQLGKPIPEGAVDLGIVMLREDGSTYRLFWAECNLGASKPEEYGDYYAWGETETKNVYSWQNYKWGAYTDYNITKYNRGDGKTVLDPEDDVAHVKLGGNWRTPTYEELKILFDLSWHFVNRNGIAGFEFKSVIEGNTNSIFLPAAGRWDADGIKDIGSIGHYWSSSLSTGSSEFAEHISFNYNHNSMSGGGAKRFTGRSIRPVTE